MMDNSVSSDGFPGSFAGSATETVPRPSPRERLLAALAGLLPRNLPASKPPSGRTNSSSSYKGASRALGVTALVLAVGLLFLLPGGLAWAQDAETIQYPENGTDAVATFTAIDPEGESVTWAVAGTDDAAFSIENGVLRFKSSPDFESPGASDNSYEVTVRASDGGQDTTAMEAVTVRVTNVEEAGMVMLSTLQPQVAVAITATLTDPDTIVGTDLATITWQWYRGNIPIAGGTNGAGAITSMYTPAAGDVGSSAER